MCATSYLSTNLDFQPSPLPAGLKPSHFYYASDLAEKRLSESRAAAEADELANKSTSHPQTASSSAIPAVFALTAAAQGGSSKPSATAIL